MNTESKLNIDRSEQEKFDAIASGWWDPDGPFRPLHDLNPARLKFVADRGYSARISLFMNSAVAAICSARGRNRLLQRKHGGSDREDEQDDD